MVCESPGINIDGSFFKVLISDHKKEDYQIATIESDFAKKDYCMITTHLK